MPSCALLYYLTGGTVQVLNTVPGEEFEVEYQLLDGATARRTKFSAVVVAPDSIANYEATVSADPSDGETDICGWLEGAALVVSSEQVQGDLDQIECAEECISRGASGATRPAALGLDQPGQCICRRGLYRIDTSFASGPVITTFVGAACRREASAACPWQTDSASGFLKFAAVADGLNRANCTAACLRLGANGVQRSRIDNPSPSCTCLFGSNSYGPVPTANEETAHLDHGQGCLGKNKIEVQV